MIENERVHPSHLPMRLGRESLHIPSPPPPPEHPFPHDHDEDFGRKDWGKHKSRIGHPSSLSISGGVGEPGQAGGIGEPGRPGHPGRSASGAPGADAPGADEVSGWYY